MRPTKLSAQFHWAFTTLGRTSHILFARRKPEAMSERTTIMKKVLLLSVFVLMVFAWISEPAIAQPYDDPWGFCLPEPNPTGAGCWDY